MKTKFTFLFFFLFSFTAFSQQSFKLKQPNVKNLRLAVEKNEAVSTKLLQLYLDNNYKTTSKKLNIKLDPDFDNKECGYTKKYEFGIVFTTFSCGEASPVIKSIKFPKTNLSELKKWVENIYKVDLTDVPNKWKDKYKYIPKDDGVGCYYTIKQTKTNSTIEIWCGC
jgi:hypothetical protein